MAEQAITQEKLFLPLLRFIADHGGEIDRQRDNLLDALADRLGLTQEERERTTEGGDKNQWRSTVEFSREKLVDLHDAIEKGERGIWQLSTEGWRLTEDPPAEWMESFDAWREERKELRPDDAPDPPERPSGLFEERLEQMRESLEVEVHETLRLARNSALVRALKEEYDYRCQLCDPEDPDCSPIPMEDGRHYVEVHHIEGLAEVAARAEHGQVEDTEYQNLTSYHNVIVICPYHHRLLHHHVPSFVFDRDDMCFWVEDGSDLIPIAIRHEPHLAPPRS